MDDPLAINRAWWDGVAPLHARSRDYAVGRFAADPEFLSDVVRFDLPRLGDVSGLDGVHLQCHIGTDTVSLARLGARMTGLDFAPAAVGEARQVAAGAGVAVDFVVGDVRDAVDLLGGARFDLVYTGVGALCWVPEIRPWAAVVAGLLRPGGRLFLREGHPVLWALDETRDDGTLLLTESYVEHAEPIISDEPGTYVETDQEPPHTVTASWNHGLGEIVTALLDQGLEITMLVEHDSVPWNAFSPGAMEQIGDGEWRLAVRPERLPHSYTLQAVRRAVVGP